MDCGLSYVRFPLTTNASWITKYQRRRFFLLGVVGRSFFRDAISLVSKRKMCIVNSTIKSKFTAFVVCSKETELLRNLIIDIALRLKPISLISIYYGSDPSLDKDYNQVYNSMSRH